MVSLGVLLPFLGVVFSCCGMHFWSRVTCLGPVHYFLFLRKDGQGDMITVALRGDVCVQPVVHTGMGSLPMRLLLLSICMLWLVHPVGGQGGRVGSPVTSTGAPRRLRGRTAGAALQVARRAKEHPELVASRRCHLTVLGIEIGGRWSSEALATFYAPHVGCPEHERLSSGTGCSRPSKH